jgi:hypothetical protein
VGRWQDDANDQITASKMIMSFNLTCNYSDIAKILLCYFNSGMNVYTSNRPLRVSLVVTFALFRLSGVQAGIALAATPNVDAITARCGSCSSSRFPCRRCLFAHRYCLWFIIARIANSSPYYRIHRYHPPANPALVTFLNDGLVGMVIFAKLIGAN